MRSLLSVLVAASFLLASGGEAHAYPDEKEGWGGVRWGDSVKTLMKRRPGIRKKGYRLGNVLSSLRRSEGGIFLDETTATYGQDEAGIRWFIRKGEGVFKVEINLEDTNPMTELSAKSIRKVLEAAHGEGGRDRERRAVWPGKVTVIEVEAPRMLTGAQVIVTHTRRSEWEGVQAELQLPDGWEADEVQAQDEAEPAAATAGGQADPALAPVAAPARAASRKGRSKAASPPTADAPQPSAMDQFRREAADRVAKSKESAKERKAEAKAKAEGAALPELQEAEGLLDPTVE